MRLLADENVQFRVVDRLRQAGFEVEWIVETMPGATDGAILDCEDIGALAFITCDRDFGDLIFNRGHPQPAAILYSRLARNDADGLVDRLLPLLREGFERGHMLTLTQDGVRAKPFPTGVDDG